MTTIAVSEGEVAVDSQLTGGNQAVRVQKLLRLPDGGVVAGCGLWRSCWAGIQWLLAGEKGEPPEIEGAELVIVRPDGGIWIAADAFPAYPILDRSYAAGCGADLARSALARGLSPVQAVAEACELDAMSSAPILSMKAEPIELPGPTVHRVKRRK